MGKLPADSKTLAGEKITSAPEGYAKIHGPITYTAAERAEWEAKLKERATRRNTSFNPSLYPKTNQV